MSTVLFALGAAPATPLASTDSILGMGVLFLLGLGLVYFGFDKYRTGRLIANTPTEKCRSVALGRTELQGTAVPEDEPAEAPFSGEDCVAAAYEIEEYRSTDDESEWVTVEAGNVAVPFHVEDDTGRVRVSAEDAEIDVSDEHVSERTVESGSSPPDRIASFVEDGPTVGVKSTADRTDKLLSSVNLTTDVDEFVGNLLQSGVSEYTGVRTDSSTERRYTEEILPPGEDVYVFGGAVERDEPGLANEERVEVTVDDMTGEFLVADRAEQDLASEYKRAAPLWMGGGVLLSAGALYLLLQGLGA